MKRILNYKFNFINRCGTISCISPEIRFGLGQTLRNWAISSGFANLLAWGTLKTLLALLGVYRMCVNDTSIIPKMCLPFLPDHSGWQWVWPWLIFSTHNLWPPVISSVAPHSIFYPSLNLYYFFLPFISCLLFSMNYETETEAIGLRFLFLLKYMCTFTAVNLTFALGFVANTVFYTFIFTQIITLYFLVNHRSFGSMIYISKYLTCFQTPPPALISIVI